MGSIHSQEEVGDRRVGQRLCFLPSRTTLELLSTVGNVLANHLTFMPTHSCGLAVRPSEWISLITAKPFAKWLHKTGRSVLTYILFLWHILNTCEPFEER